MRDPVLLRLYVATFLYTFSMALALPLLPEHMKLSFDASLRFIGVVLGLYGLMQIVLRLPMGDMADRRGRKPSIVLAFLATAVSGLFFALAPSKEWLVPGVLLFGFAGGVYWVAANSYLFDRGGDMARSTSDYTIAMSLAFIAGPTLGHLVADSMGFGAAFYLTVAASLAGALLTLTLPEVPPKPRAPPVGSPYARAWKLLSHPALVLSAAGTFTYSLLFATQQSFFQLHALAVGVSVTIVGLLLGGRQASALVVRIGLPALLRRVGAARVMIVGMGVLALSTGLVPFATTLGSLVALVALAGLATGALIPANLMLVHEGAPEGQRGLANGIYGTMLGVGSALAPALFGAIGERFGLPWTFWSAAAVGTLLLLVFATLALRRPSRSDRAE